MATPVIPTLLRILWPPAAPVDDVHGRAGRRWWITTCVLLVLPVTAVVHHAVFYRPSCILNPFGPDYHLPAPQYGNRPVALVWLMEDPSLWVAIVLCVTAYFLGKALTGVRVLAAPAFIATLPLTVWLWDIPFSGRWICKHFHDRLYEIAPGVPLRSMHFYGLAAVLYAIFGALLLWRLRRTQWLGRRGFEVVSAR